MLMISDRDDLALWECELADHVYADPRVGMIARGEIPPSDLDPVSREARLTEAALLFFVVLMIGAGMLVGLSLP